MSDFHLDEVVLRAYQADRLADSDAWSVEAHLTRCVACRDRLTLDEPTGALVAEVAASLRGDLPARGRVRAGTRSRRLLVLVGAGPAARTGWLLSVVITLGLTLALAAYPLLVRPWLLLLIAPVLPVLGIAASYGPSTDPLHELVASSPYGGLRIILWRALSVLTVTVPVALVAGAVTGIGVPAMWLLPCLGLTALTLGLGALMETGRAALLVAVAWVVLVFAPVNHAALVEPATGPGWLLVTAVATALLFVRRDRLGRGVPR
ncbi:zf-HC2 domain-containing protein [Micromonospora sp. NPDC050397]|uniref:zf-HC2 domain-containing protein n=1 Tax=Micromonospora sp. NPDC050397 TaxID=3364279 RepID=UPI00384F60C4